MSKETNGEVPSTPTAFKIEKLKESFSNDVAEGMISVFKDLQKAEFDAYKAKLAAQKPFFEKRSALIKNTPKFWLNVFGRSNLFRHFVTAGDQEALEYLEDITVDWKEDPRDFDIVFHFKENPFIKSSTLTKTYTVQPPAGASSSSPNGNVEPYDLDAEVHGVPTTVDWKSDEKNLVKQYPRKEPKDVENVEEMDEDEDLSPGSFFHIFGEGPEDVLGLGESFLEIYVNAHEVYAGLHDDEIIDEEEDDDDEEEGDDDKEVDLDEEEAKRQKKRQRTE